MGWQRVQDTDKQIPKLSSRETSEKNSHFSNYYILKEESPRKVGWGTGSWITEGIRVGWYWLHRANCWFFMNFVIRILNIARLLNIKLNYEKINYIKNKGNSVQNSLFHLIIIQALEVIYTYHVCGCVMKILYKGITSHPLPTLWCHVDCLKSAVELWQEDFHR